MKFLPGNDSFDALSAIDDRKIEFFFEQFVVRNSEEYGKGHFILACYAALPAVLTPDLLHKMWLNFKNYMLDEEPEVIHPVAPADILLSPLVEEIGFELYEMPEQIRKALLKYLQNETSSVGINQMKLFGLDTIAEFLRDYINYDFTPENKDDDAFREAQEWTALSYLDPGKAFAEVAQAFQKSQTDSGRARYKDAIEKMSARFALNIVKDENAIPKDFKAMAALTSVIRDVLSERDPSRLEELKAEAVKANDLLTTVPLVRSNVINIEIPEEVGKKITSTQRSNPTVTGKLKAFIVGIGRQSLGGNNTDEATASLFSDCISRRFGNGHAEIRLVSGSNATKMAILNGWQEVLENATEQDNVVFYLAANAVAHEGHCSVVCADTNVNSNEAATFLMDQQIGEMAKAARYSSLTMILQLDHAATSYWLDSSNPKNILFASSKFEQLPRFLNVARPDGTYCAFSYALTETLRSNLMPLSNRDFFTRVIRFYEDLTKETGSVSYTWESKAPQLVCNSVAYDWLFLQGKNSTAELQKLLHDNNQMTNGITGLWDSPTSAALGSYIRQHNLSKFTKQEYISQLRKNKEMGLQQGLPIFLLIFSDPEKKLTALESEKKEITEKLDEVSSTISYHILNDPDKTELTKFLENPLYRNKIQLIYYSGNDDRGNFVLKNGSFDLFDLAPSLIYQENIKLLVANTCRSEFLADYVTQLGIYSAIGCKGEVKDTIAADFGKSLFEWIIDGKQVNEYMDVEQKLANDKSTRFRYFKSLGTDGKIDWGFITVPPPDSNVFSLSIGFENYQYFGKTDSIQDVLSFNSWLREKFPADNSFMIYDSPDLLPSQYDIDEAFQKVFSKIRNSNLIKSTLFVYLSGKGAIVQSGSPVLFFPGMSSEMPNLCLNMQAYCSALIDSGLFEKIFMFYDLDRSESFPFGEGLSPLFAFPQSLNSGSGLLLGVLSPFSNREYESNQSPVEQHGLFTQLLLQALYGDATDANGNITTVSLRDYIDAGLRDKMVLNSNVFGNDNIKIISGIQIKKKKVILSFSNKQTGKTIRILDNNLNEVYSDLIKNTIIELDLEPGVYQAQIAEKEISRFFTVDNAGESLTVDLGWIFRDQWICVVGSGTDLSQEQTLAGEAIGAFLAKEGYGLITGGWPGTDHVTAESYYNEMLAYGGNKAGDYLVNIINDREKPDYNYGRTEYVSEADWEATVINRSHAIISIGGKGYTYKIYEASQQYPIAFIPLPYTGGDSKKIFNELVGEGNRVISPVLLEHLGNIKTVNEECLEIIRSMLDTIDKQSKSEPSAFIIHSYHNLQYADRISKYLEENGIYVFSHAEAGTSPSDFFSQQVKRSLLDSEYALVLVSREVARTQYLIDEINTAIKENKKIIPLLIEKVNIPSQLKDYAFIDLSDDFGLGMNTLLNRLNTESKDSNDFTEVVKKMYSEKEVIVPGDLQKRRWGGQNEVNGITMQAQVTKIAGSNFEVSIIIHDANRKIDQQVAFFLHDTFKEIEYSRLVNAEAVLSVNAYQAFTVGAYLEDGTMLELDLNKVKGYPEDFYYSTLFLIYSRFNTQNAVKLINELKDNGKKTFQTDKNIKREPGYFEEIIPFMDESEVVLVMLTHRSVESKNVLSELDLAVEKNKKIIPLLMENCDIPYSLKMLEYIDMSVDYDAGLKKLLAFLDSKDLSDYDSVVLAAENSVEYKLSRKNKFCTEKEIRQLIDAAVKHPDKATDSLLIFETTKQHTWLVFTNNTVYIILDDENTRKEKSLIQDSFAKSKILPLRFRDSRKVKGARNVQFAAQATWWYYSMSLFPGEEDFSKAVQNIIIS